LGHMTGTHCGNREPVLQHDRRSDHHGLLRPRLQSVGRALGPLHPHALRPPRRGVFHAVQLRRQPVRFRFHRPHVPPLGCGFRPLHQHATGGCGCVLAHAHVPPLFASALLSSHKRAKRLSGRLARVHARVHCGSRFGSYSDACDCQTILPSWAAGLWGTEPEAADCSGIQTLIASGRFAERWWAGDVLTRQGHTDEVLDVCFDATGKRFVSASADATARIYNTMTGQCLHTLSGHEGEISKVSFNPQVGLRLSKCICIISLACCLDH
jgi:hypothetical protein